ncbi:hypothetical protein BU15DRAFT_77621 [Melanogaster broomeanus]|nr:hypothetical protein BU15DRAFT_77621 [Melanogaster broomeanus]
MSAAAQDQAASAAENLQSTPAVKKDGPHSTELPPAQREANHKLAVDMKGRFIGPMPVEVFLEKYLTSTVKVEDHPEVPRDAFSKVATAVDEKRMYDPFVQAIAPWMLGLKAVNTSASVDTGDFPLKPDVSIFKKEYVPDRSRADFSAMEMFVEFKKSSKDAPFTDPPDKSEAARQAAIQSGSFESASNEAMKIRGQLTAYAIAHHGHQFRHFSFSVVIVGTQARFIRWDASAVVVTAQFDYNQNPEIMAKFFWQFSNLPAKLRGHDESVCPAKLQTDVEERVRSGLNLVSETPLFRYSVPGLKGYCYGPRPPYPSRSIVGRTTRTLPVWFVPPQPADEQHVEHHPQQHIKQEEASAYDPRWAIERAVYLKDCWRFISFAHNVQPEHEIYEMLNSKDTPNIPTSVCGGDVEGPGSRTDTHTLVDAPWLCVELKVTPFIHYRLVLDVVGRPLTSFRCTKELVRGVLDAMRAHKFAYEVLQLLHRDISPGNIILTEDGRGLLIDWELAKTVGEIGNRRRERTGTWQFMSAALLRKPGKLHMLEDDIESFIHVLGWTTIKYLFDIIDFHLEGAAVGGKAKARELRGGGYPPETFELKRPSPLSRLLRDLSSPFKSRYTREPPTDEIRAQLLTLTDVADDEHLPCCPLFGCMTGI